VLQELAQTPLMLSIMSLAFQEGGADQLAAQKGDSPEERRKQIFRLYVEQMFQRKGTTSLEFPKEKTIGWLSWMARKMREHSQSVFFVEELQPSWLGEIAQQITYLTIVASSNGLIFGLGGGLIFGLTFGLVGGLLGGLLDGLLGTLILTFLQVVIAAFLSLDPYNRVGGLGYITLAENMRWEWNKVWAGLAALMYGLIFGGIFYLIFGAWGLIGGLTVGGGLTIGWMVIVEDTTTDNGLTYGFTDRVKVGKVSPNQGIKLSLKNAFTVFLVTWLVAGLIFGLIFGLRGGLIGGLSVGGLIGGLSRGGSAVIKHYALRLVLWRRGYTPFNFVKFLDHCAKLIFLKKVGGGYIFIHRMLLDYFAEMTPQSTKIEHGKTGSVGP
jgi:eukaryotic-like serine/threonine-protein kinase